MGLLTGSLPAIGHDLLAYYNSSGALIEASGQVSVGLIEFVLATQPEDIHLGQGAFFQLLTKT